ncbi:hypothetical protein KR018_009638 [Drosophila ironensis]|nr:hypothetical protein KR018_009638 [Drosophila ironensis]
MSKSVSIVLPDEMQSVSARCNMSSGSKMKKSLESAPPVFVVVSQESGNSSELSRHEISSSVGSLQSSNKDCMLERPPRADLSADHGALVPSDSWSAQPPNNLDSTGSSIKQFLKNTVALIRAGESFTSVKRLFYNFVKTSGGNISNTTSNEASIASSTGRLDSGSTTRALRMTSPNITHSTDTFLSNIPHSLTVPSSTQMTSSMPRSNFSLNSVRYDVNLLSEMTPLTGYTTNSMQASNEEIYFWSDASQRTNATEKTTTKDYKSESTVRGSRRKPILVKGQMSESVMSNRSTISKPSFTLPRRSMSKQQISTKQAHKMLRTDPPINKSTPEIYPTFALVNSSLRNFGENPSQQPRKSRSSSAQNSSTLSHRLKPDQMFENSVRRLSYQSINSRGTNGQESSSHSQSSKPTRPKRYVRISDDPVFLTDYAFALVSPEEAEVSKPTEADNNTKGIEESSTSCPTFQEDCNCHHCQDMRRALKRVEYFQSPKGQRQLEAKLLSKNIFMDLYAMSQVRKQIKDDLYGKRSHAPARVSYPVSICGANRLDAGSLSLTWFTHDLDGVDHYDVFVDDVPSRSVYNARATSTVLIDVDTRKTHRLLLRAVPVRGYGSQASPVDNFMSEVLAGHMKNVRKGNLFACCLRYMDTECKRHSLVDYWTDSEFLYMPS